MAGNPKVFFDITIGGAAAGRIVMEVCTQGASSAPLPTRFLGLFSMDVCLFFRRMLI
jgi:hypothetical protein